MNCYNQVLPRGRKSPVFSVVLISALVPPHIETKLSCVSIIFFNTFLIDFQIFLSALTKSFGLLFSNKTLLYCCIYANKFKTDLQIFALIKVNLPMMSFILKTYLVFCFASRKPVEMYVTANIIVMVNVDHWSLVYDN